MSNFLGLDVGTSSIKAAVLDTDIGKLRTLAKVETPIHYFSPYQAEHSPGQLVAAVCECIRQAVKDIKVDGLGISCFAEAGLPLNQNGEPLYPIIAWFDQRSQPQVKPFLEKLSKEEITFITGQKAAFSFGLFKYLWLKENHPEIVKDMQIWLSAADYLLYALTGHIYTDYTQASRTMLFDQQSLDWSEKILTAVSLSKSMLPKIAPSGNVIGEITTKAAALTGLAKGTPCSVGGHDHLCGTFASGGCESNQIVDSSGSSQAIIALTESYQPQEKLFQSGFVHYHHVTPGQYIIKGGLKAAGKAFKWLTEGLNFSSIPNLDKIIDFRFKNDCQYPLMLPFFQGSGTPDRDPLAKAAFLGLHLGQCADDVLLSFYEGLGFWLKDNIIAISKFISSDFQSLITIGGTNQNNDLRRIKASITNLPVIYPELPEPSAVGAALLAALGNGIYPNHQHAQRSLDYSYHTIEPEKQLTDYYGEIFHQLYLPAKKALKPIQLAHHDFYIKIKPKNEKETQCGHST